MFQKFNVIETWLGFFWFFFLFFGGEGGGCKCCTTVLFTTRVSLIFSIRVLVWNNNILYLSFAICSKSRKFRLYYASQNVVLYRESLAFINEKRFFYLLHWAPWDFVISINKERERESFNFVLDWVIWWMKKKRIGTWYIDSMSRQSSITTWFVNGRSHDRFTFTEFEIFIKYQRNNKGPSSCYNDLMHGFDNDCSID